ncbi:MAG TPA: hypothetical protein VF399_09595 [bacterium]
MKSLHLYEVKLIDGTLYRGEIPYRDDKMIIMRSGSVEQNKIRLYYSGIVSIRELGWRKVCVSAVDKAPVSAGGSE